MCRPGRPATRRGAWLATELLPRGCYIDFGEAKIRAAIRHWDESNAIFRCACVCPECRYRPCNRRMWWTTITTSATVANASAGVIAIFCQADLR